MIWLQSHLNRSSCCQDGKVFEQVLKNLLGYFRQLLQAVLHLSSYIVACDVQQLQLLVSLGQFVLICILDELA